jgi:hypothetical protein
MLRLLRWPAVAILGLTVSACATMNVSSHVERGLDFTQYHTWQWAPADALPESNPRLNNSFFQDHFQGAVERQFSARGLVQTFSDNAAPDLLVHYHANVSPQMQVVTDQAGSGACYDANCTVRVLDNEMDTIVLDVVDARTNRLIWRGWAQNATAGAIDHPTRFNTRIQQAVARMFARFPKTTS